MFTIILLIAFIYVCYITYWSLLRDSAKPYVDFIKLYFDRNTYYSLIWEESKQWKGIERVINPILIVLGPIIAIPLLLVVVIKDAHNYRRK